MKCHKVICVLLAMITLAICNQAFAQNSFILSARAARQSVSSHLRQANAASPSPAIGRFVLISADVVAPITYRLEPDHPARVKVLAAKPTEGKNVCVVSLTSADYILPIDMGSPGAGGIRMNSLILS